MPRYSQTSAFYTHDYSTQSRRPPTLCQRLGLCVWSYPCALWHRLQLSSTGTKGNPRPVMEHGSYLLQGWGQNLLHLFNATLPINPHRGLQPTAWSLDQDRSKVSVSRELGGHYHKLITGHYGRSAAKSLQCDGHWNDRHKSDNNQCVLRLHPKIWCFQSDSSPVGRN